MPEGLSVSPKMEQVLQNAVATVKGKESSVIAWTESAEITSLSGNGAGLSLSRPCVPGRLLALMIPMPQHLRSYDKDKKLYRVWGLVQHCYEAVEDGQKVYHIGVALIGKNPPESYQHDPTLSYRIVGIDKQGLWRVEELEGSFKSRRSVRFWNSLRGSIFLLDAEQRTIAADEIETENVSETGASVFSNMRTAIGDRVKFVCHSPSFTCLAVVRNRRIGPDDRTRIHLEFIDGKFPVADISSPVKETSKL